MRVVQALRGADAASRPGAAFAAMLDGALRPTLLCVPFVVGALWVFRHNTGGIAAALGALVTVGFFWAGLAVMTRLVGDSNPVTLLAAALAVYFGQVLLLGGVILGLSGASWLDGVAFGLAALAMTLLWQVFQVRAFVRARRDVFETRSVEGGADGATTAPR